MKTIMLLGISLIFIGQIKGQSFYDNIPNSNCDSTLRIYHPTRHVLLYQMGDRTIGYKSFKAHLLSFPDSAKEFKKSKRIGNAAMILMGGTVASGIPALSLPSSSKASLVLSCISLGSYVTSTTLIFISAKHFRKSIKLYNKEICNRRI